MMSLNLENRGIIFFKEFNFEASAIFALNASIVARTDLCFIYTFLLCLYIVLFQEVFSLVGIAYTWGEGGGIGKGSSLSLFPG